MPVTLYATFLITLIVTGEGGRKNITQIIKDFGAWGLFTPKPISDMNEVKMKWFNVKL